MIGFRRLAYRHGLLTRLIRMCFQQQLEVTPALAAFEPQCLGQRDDARLGRLDAFGGGGQFQLDERAQRFHLVERDLNLSILPNHLGLSAALADLADGRKAQRLQQTSPCCEPLLVDRQGNLDFAASLRDRVDLRAFVSDDVLSVLSPEPQGLVRLGEIAARMGKIRVCSLKWGPISTPPSSPAAPQTRPCRKAGNFISTS